MDELKPCPFCGNSVAVRILDQNEVEYREEGDSDYADHPCYQVVCCINDDSPVPTPGWAPGCGASGGFRKTPEEAIAAWNRRAAPENKALTCEGCIGKEKQPRNRAYWGCQTCTRNTNIKDEYSARRPEAAP